MKIPKDTDRRKVPFKQLKSLEKGVGGIIGYLNSISRVYLII